MSAGGRRNRGSECVARRFRSQTAGRRQMRAENSLLPRLGDWAFCGATGPTAKHAYIYTYVMNFYLMGPLPSRALGRRTRRPGPEPGLFLAPPPPKRCRAHRGRPLRRPPPCRPVCQPCPAALDTNKACRAAGWPHAGGERHAVTEPSMAVVAEEGRRWR